MMDKKAQGALEFLTTYGWAFLVILIMIGALGYFGILNPTRFLPERCNVNTEFSCEEFAITSSGSSQLVFDVILTNSIGEGIVLNTSTDTLTLESDIFGGSVPTTLSAAGAPTMPSNAISCGLTGSTATIDPNGDLHLQCMAQGSALATSVPSAGNKLKIAFAMQYTPRGKTLQKPISGEIFAAVQ